MLKVQQIGVTHQLFDEIVAHGFTEAEGWKRHPVLDHLVSKAEADSIDVLVLIDEWSMVDDPFGAFSRKMHVGLTPAAPPHWVESKGD